MNYLSQPPKAELKTALAGRYKIEAVKADGSRRLLADWFDNLITDNGLNAIGHGADWFTGCSVGSGNTAPANSDTSLVSLVATTTTITTTTGANSGGLPWFGSQTVVYRFPIGSATGNLSEVGIGATSTSLFSRALILDGGGSPTTITVLSSEALDVTYQLQQFSPASDVTGSVTIAAVSYAYTVRAANANAGGWTVRPVGDRGGVLSSGVTVYNGSIGTVTGSPSGTSAAGGTASLGTYTDGNFFVDSTLNLGLADANVSGGISAIMCTMGSLNASLGQYQYGFSPALPKDSSHTMTLVIRHSWTRH